MIAAGVLPACGAAWHRGVFEWVRAGRWADLPGAAHWAPEAWLAAPAALVTLAAIIAAASGALRTLVVLLGVATLVHPTLAFVLTPLALAVRERPPLTWRLTLVVVALATTGVALTPRCGDAVIAPLGLASLAGAWMAVLGLGGLALLAIDVAFGSSRRWQVAALAVLAGCAGLLVRGWAADASALLGVSSAVLGWRAAAGAWLVVSWQQALLARAGAAALVVLVPFVTVAGAYRSDAEPPIGAPTRWAALEAAGGPAALILAGDEADTAAVIWRAGPSEAQRSLVTIPPEPEAVSPQLATRAVYTWDRLARLLSMRGMLVAPIPGPDGRPPLLWRVLQFERCQALSTDWVDVSAAAAGGQLAGRFPLIEPARGLLLYLASARPLDAQPIDWPPETLQGLSARSFDRESPDDASALADAAARDAVPAQAITAARYVTRLRMDRQGTAPETLGVRFGSVVSAAWARRYVAGDTRPDRQLSLCRSSVGVPVAAYAGAPAEIAVDLFSPFAVGGGWHGPERAGDDPFRWTAEPEADLLFVAHRPQPLVLRLDAQPGTPEWDDADLGVFLNGQPARCHTGVPPCDWVLPPEAMHTGLNVLTLHSTTVPAPAPETRRLGLMVRAVTLGR